MQLYVFNMYIFLALAFSIIYIYKYISIKHI